MGVDPPKIVLDFDLSSIEWPTNAPYANASYTFINQLPEVTVVFLRSPLLTDEAAARVAASKKIAPHVVTSVTMNKEKAQEMFTSILEMLKRLP